MTILRPGSDYGDPPAIWITVPSNRVKAWRELIKIWLGEIAADQTKREADPLTPFNPPQPPSNVHPIARRGTA